MSNLELAKIVAGLSQFDDTKLADMAPTLAQVSYVNREHAEASKKK